MNPRDKRHIKELHTFFDQVQGKQTPHVNLSLPNKDQIISSLSKPQQDIFHSTQAINLFLGGQGSGKTYLGGCVSGYTIGNSPTAIGMICANTYLQLTQSTMYRIRQCWRSRFNWTEYDPYKKIGEYVVGVTPPLEFNTENHDYDTYRNIISFKNGAVIYYGSLDNYKALDGKEVAWAILDETKDTKEDAVKEVILGRLRQKAIILPDGRIFNPLYLLTSPAKTAWLNEWFELEDYEAEINALIFSEETYFSKTIKNKQVVIASTYHNADHLPPDYIANQKINLNTRLQDMLIYGSPFNKNGGEFYKSFDRGQHSGKSHYQPDLPLHISFDFNVNPYITLLITQIEDKKIWILEEICLESPRNNTARLCREFIKHYQNHRAGLFIYGDPAGKHKDTRSEKGYNDYTIIRNELKSYNPAMRVEVKAPAVVPRANFINQILEKELYGISIHINDSCKNLLADLTYLKEASDGSKHKEREQKNGVSYEKYGHCSDALDYLIVSAFREEYGRYLRGGEEKRFYLSGIFKRNPNR